MFRLEPQDDGQIKEVHYMGRSPHVVGSEEAYLDVFPSAIVQEAQANATAQLDARHLEDDSFKSPEDVQLAAEVVRHSVAFMDASVESMLMPHVPARAKIIMPHARLVIVLRDPVKRALSAYNEYHSLLCDTEEPNITRPTACPPKTWLETIQENSSPQNRTGCMFDGKDKGPLQTWQDCFQCWQFYSDRTECQLMQPQPYDDCGPTPFTYVQSSLYAAQIAWWLAFFHPEQFLILTSEELRDPDRQVEVLNRVLDHARLTSAPRFTESQLKDVKGLDGTYAQELSPEIKEGIELLRQSYQRPLQDLKTLLNTYWPAMDFTRLTEEI